MRNRKFLAALLATAAAAVAAPALAASPIVTVGSYGDPNGLQAGEVMVADFNNAGTPNAVLLQGFTLTLNGATVGVGEGAAGYSGTLPGDNTHYLTIPGGATATLVSDSLLKTFSLYMGSPDSYNSIRFIGANYDYTLSGGQITEGNTSQSWEYGARVNFDFGDYSVNQIILSSSSNSFESDNFAVTSAAVPEPATWAMMIMGFGTIGVAMRRRRMAFAAA